MRPRLRTIALAALLALALTLPATASAAERTVSVTATATRTVPNDSASVGLSVSLVRDSRASALRAVSSRLRAVIAAVQAVPGVGAGDVTTGRISVRREGRGPRSRYRAGEGIGVVLHEPERAGELIGTAIAAGATGVSGPSFFLADPAAAFSTALVAAFEGAKTKAAALAAAAGATLGPALTVEESGPVYESAPAAGKSPSPCAAGAPTARRPRLCTSTPPVKPGTATVSATVHVVFALQ